VGSTKIKQKGKKMRHGKYGAKHKISHFEHLVLQYMQLLLLLQKEE
jgi:hypothetical protein